MIEFIALALFMFLVIALYAALHLHRKSQVLASQLTVLASSKQSLSTRYGKMSEQFFPFLDHYPYDPQQFRFLGTPVDGIQFEDDRIVFVEFKSASSGLTSRQRLIRSLVEQGKVSFEEFRITDKNTENNKKQVE